MPHSPESWSAPVRESTAWLAGYRTLLLPHSLILDLGSGTGDDVRDLVFLNCRVIGVDVDRDRLRSSLPIEGAVGFVCADMAHGLPFGDQAFDLVTASLSLHYFDAQTTRRVVREVARLLRHGGPLIMRVNAAGDTNFGFGAGPEIESGLFRQPDGRIKRFFTPELLEQFLEPCFTVQRISPRTISQNGLVKRTLECVSFRRE